MGAQQLISRALYGWGRRLALIVSDYSPGPCTDKAGAPEGVCYIDDGVRGAPLGWGGDYTQGGFFRLGIELDGVEVSSLHHDRKLGLFIQKEQNLLVEVEILSLPF